MTMALMIYLIFIRQTDNAERQAATTLAASEVRQQRSVAKK